MDLTDRTTSDDRGPLATPVPVTHAPVAPADILEPNHLEQREENAHPDDGDGGDRGGAAQDVESLDGLGEDDMETQHAREDTERIVYTLLDQLGFPGEFGDNYIPFVDDFIQRPVPVGHNMRCKIRRQKSKRGAAPQYLMYAEAPDGHPYIHLLSARKLRKATHTSSHYLISRHTETILQGTPEMVGELHSNFLGTEFVVLRRTGYRPTVVAQPQLQQGSSVTSDGGGMSPQGEAEVDEAVAGLNRLAVSASLVTMPLVGTPDLSPGAAPLPTSAPHLPVSNSRRPRNGGGGGGTLRRLLRRRTAVITNNRIDLPTTVEGHSGISNNGENHDNCNDPGLTSIAATGAQEETCAILYDPNILGFKGPRKMTLILPALSFDGTPLPFQPRPNAPSLITSYRNMYNPDLLVLHNKPPQWNVDTQSYVLNFNGRVTVSSVKNFQVVNDHDFDYVILQFGRVLEDAFTLDFQYPITPLQAFGIALSSFDDKLACE
ncbi:hypothetical protein IWQ60_008797 [Tieghemiomyces parasiticus]|uniref:Tubby C-terminal domain-containing protein n=1 Tax=Tieghemiomyces parasiticus TaxID=78921 RepID=A0A9W7ZWC4_9FUNG|nr:hypothetical protein IWQ60_008797 [Tieghemiomyces parasiticus]